MHEELKGNREKGTLKIYFRIEDIVLSARIFLDIHVS